MMRASSVRAGWLRAWPRQVAVALFVIGVLLPVHSFAAALAGPAASGEHMAQLVVGVVLLKVALIVHAILFALIPSLPLAPPAGQGLAPGAALPGSGPWSRAEAGAVVCILVLGAGTDKKGPGPLVTTLSRNSGTLPIPITIVPGDMSKERLEAIT